jgi:formylglycine-generating enzyme required for sulfatase activity
MAAAAIFHGHRWPLGSVFLFISALCGCDAPPQVPVDSLPADAAGADAPIRDAGSDSQAPLDGSLCPEEMAQVGSFCVDRWEAHTVEIDPNGVEQMHSPYQTIRDAGVYARSSPNVVPQAYISQVEAQAACARAGKRLCSATEFALACRGPSAANDYPYGGTTRMPGWCNEGKGSSMPLFFGSNASLWTYAEFNDPRLDQWDGGLAPTASYPHCVSPSGVWDCVGNLHEWGSDPPDVNGHGRFRGGFYGDAELNGHGCLYVTSAHEITYHDYSTGFRCCRDTL